MHSNTTDLLLYSTDSLQNGDIILRKGYGMISEIVTIKLKDSIDVSHCGIIVENAQGGYDVIHALSKSVSETDGVQICSLDYFVNDSKPETIRVLRYINDVDNKIAKSAYEYLNRRVPFDEKFDITDSTALFCSELPLLILKNNYKLDLWPNKSGIPTFSLFLNPTYFREIYFIKKAN